MLIRPAQDSDSSAIWQILEPTIRAGETYPLPRDMTRYEALDFWLSNGGEVFVAEEDDQIIGTYFLRSNSPGGGRHVANCAYVTAAWAAGLGIGSALCAHSIVCAKARRFRAIQLNAVVSTNEPALKLSHNFGFEIVGRLPGAFEHPKLGYVDAFVMYRDL